MKREALHKNSGFTVPEGYFGAFEESLFVKIAEERLPDTEGYGVPEGYFEAFEDRLLGKLSAEKAPKVVAITAYKKVYYALGAVAAALLLFVGIKGFLPGGTTAEITEGTVSVTEVETYIDNGYMALDSYAIAEVFNEELAAIEMVPEYDIDDEQLIDYLHEHVENYNDLITGD